MRALRTTLVAVASTCLLAPKFACAHGSSEHVAPQPRSPDHDQKDWGTRHMIEEHHVDNYDPGAFFALHDFDENGQWTAHEILRTYGINVDTSRLVDDTGNDDMTPKGYVSEEQKNHILKEIMGLMDINKDNMIDLHEFLAYYHEGGRLPDFHFGPGHHGDDEYEYELHHYEKYHDENTKEEDLTHPEDIAHFKKHEQQERDEEIFEQQEKLKIVEKNIPAKFRA